MENSHTDKPETPTLEYYRDLNEKKWNKILKLEAENASLKAERDKLSKQNDRLEDRFERDQDKVKELQQENETLKEKISCTLGVGSGDGKLFVHGDYDSIKAAQAIILERDALREQLDKTNQRANSLSSTLDQYYWKISAEQQKNGELRDQNEKQDSLLNRIYREIGAHLESTQNGK
jgi:DNA repair exonuclease SbcCD ATPase subunit